MTEVTCLYCDVENDSREWLSHTAIAVVGYPDHSTVGNITDPKVTEDMNYFWICPHCDRQVRGNEIYVEGTGRVEEVPEPQSTTVTLSINLDIEPGWSKERILKELHNYLVEVVDADNPPENVFHEIAIEGIDF